MKRPAIITVFLTIACFSYGQTKKVIFVCEHGAAKSFIATEYFNKLAKENNLDWKAECRATAPDSALTIATRNGLKSDNLYDPHRIPQKVSYEDTTSAEKIILFSKLPTDWHSDIETEDWSTTPGIDGSYEQRKEAIIKKLKELISSLR